MKTYNPYKLFVGAFIPNWLMCRSEISPGAKLCFARLAQFAGADGECYPSQAKLGRELGTGDRNVRKYLSELEKHGLITVEQRGLNRPNLYRFTWHKWLDSGPEQSFHTGPEQSFLPDRNNRSGQERNNRSDKENQLRESEKRGGPLNLPAFVQSIMDGFDE